MLAPPRSPRLPTLCREARHVNREGALLWALVDALATEQGTRQVLDWAPDARTRSAPTTTRGVCAVDMTTGASGPGGASEVCQETVGMESILLFPTEGDLILAKRPQT